MYFLQGAATIWEREMVRYMRDKMRIFLTIFQPLMFLTIFGSGLKKTFSSGHLGIDSVQFMYPGIIAMSIMGVAFYSTVSTVWDREFGFLKEILVAPVSRTAIILGKALGSVSLAFFQALILLVIAPFIGIAIHLDIIPYLFLFMILLAFSIAGMGLLIASIMKTIENFGVIMNVLVFPMFFLSGAFFPLKDIPLWMNLLSKINPLSYSVDAFRQLMLAPSLKPEIIKHIIQYPIYINALFLIIFSITMISSAVIAFNKSE